MTALGQDLRYALRMLRQSPGFAAVAIVTLALGIGANTAIFTVVQSVLLKPLPFERPGELVRVTADLTGQGLKDVGASVPELFDYRDRAGIFSAASGLFSIDANITGMDRPERAEALLVDVSYFDILGVKAQVGRLFAPSDYRPGIAEVAVVSDGWWRRHYAADPNVVGKTCRLDDDLYTIIGVAPRGFRHPGRFIQNDVEIWAPTGWIASPFQPTPNRRAYFLQGVLARLKPGVTPAAAQRRIDSLAGAWRQEFSKDYPPQDGWTPQVRPLRDDLVGNVRPALLVLLTAVGFVLLISCANVANLLLARASGRRREIAVRQALGAPRGRLIRQLLTESLLLSLSGGALGLAVAAWGVDLLVRMSPSTLPRLGEVRLDAGVLLFTLVVSMATGLIFGIAPALQASASQLSATLQDTARGSAGARGNRVRSLLVVTEFALAVVLLVGAALLVRTLWRLQRVHPGFDPKGVVMASLWLPQPNIPENGRYFSNAAQASLYRRLIQRVQALPGVAAASGSVRVPFGSARATGPFRIEGGDPERWTGSAEMSSPATGYFATLRIPLLRGRFFTDQDEEKAPAVAIISDALAQKYFAGQDPIGRRLQMPARTGPGPWMTIVGVVGDVKTAGLDLDERPLLYRPMLQAPSLLFTLLVRGSATPAALSSAIEQELRAIDPELPIYGVRTMEGAMASTFGERRFAMQLLGIFAIVALLLSAVGVYGVVAYGVSQRTREIGIRMALGARPADVRRMLLREGGRLAALGVMAGVAGALVLTRAMSALLYGVGPRDPATFAAVPAVLAAVALAATYFPARRASRVDPLSALRAE
ncbi:MAG: ABC transporter permease [Acidobacteriota bacterium]